MKVLVFDNNGNRAIMVVGCLVSLVVRMKKTSDVRCLAVRAHRGKKEVVL